MKQTNELHAAPGTDLADLVEEFAGLVQAGVAIDAESFARAHPAQAEELRRLLPAVRALTDLGAQPCSGPGELDAATGLPGGRLGDFQLLREVGRGGMGIVYEAEQLSLGRRVAVKVLPSAAALDERHLQRFRNEAQAAALLHHPHIVPVLAVGQHQQTHFFAMQFINGESLASLVADLRLWMGSETNTVTMPGRSGPLADYDSSLVAQGGVPVPLPSTSGEATPAPAGVALPTSGHTRRFNPLATESAGRDRAYFRNVARLLFQAAQALDHAHQTGVIHRDVKPANLLVDSQGELWVTDFGLARLSTAPGVTATGDLLGTIRYMSPEQAQASRATIDHRTDVYGLGVTAYELLTFRPAFPGEDRQELLRRIASEEPPRPRRINRAVPAELEAVVLKAMEKSPADRYATAQELADDLSRFLEDRPVRARRPTLCRVAAKWSRRHAGLLAITTAPVLVVLAVAVCLLFASNSKLQEEKENVRLAAEKAETNATRANYNGHLLREAMNDVILKLADENLKRDREYANKVGEILDRAVKVYSELATGAEGDIEQEMQVAWGYAYAGQLYAFLGRSEQALVAYHKGMAMAERLVAARPNLFKNRFILATCHRQIGVLNWQLGKEKEAAAELQEALDTWVRPHPIPACPFEASESHAGLGEVEETSGNAAKAVDHYRAAIALREGLPPQVKKDLGQRSLMGTWRRSLGVVLLDMGNRAEAEKQLCLSAELAEGVLQECEKDPKTAGACRLEVAQISLYLGALYEVRDPQLAQRYYGRAATLYDTLSKAAPGDPNFLLNLGDMHYHLGVLASTNSRKADATTEFRRAQEVFAALVKPPKGVVYGPGPPGACENVYAWFLAACPDESFRNPRLAVELALKATGRAKDKADYWNTLAAAYYRAGNAKAAATAVEKAIQLRKAGQGADLFLLALAHRRLDHPKQAIAAYEQAIDWTQQHNGENLELRLLRAETAACLGVREPSPATP